MAEAVVKQYGTPLLLFKAYERAIRAAAQQGRNPTEAARQLLVSCQLSKNRRPISANNSARVFDSLFANGWQCIIMFERMNAEIGTVSNCKLAILLTLAVSLVFVRLSVHL